MLPYVKNGDGIRRRIQDTFRGMNHNPAAGDGEIYDCRNMSGRYYPAAASRPLRHSIDIRENITEALENGWTVVDEYVYENVIYAVAVSFGDGGGVKLCCADISNAAPTAVVIGDLTAPAEEKRTFAVLGRRLIVFPDHMMCMIDDLSAGLVDLDAVTEIPAGGAEYNSGEVAGVSATYNVLHNKSGTFEGFRIGDAVKVTGAANPSNNVTAVLQGISDDKKNLIFADNTFPEHYIGTELEPNAITVSRAVPEDAWMTIEHAGRLWAIGKRTLYASALGDPYNWNKFEGVSTDSYALEIQGEGELTGICSYTYPTVFSETAMYRIYGSYPSAYQASSIPCCGMKRGCSATAAVCAGYLFYLSPQGVMRYAGSGVPQHISGDIGEDRQNEGVAGSDGRRYYISMQSGSGSNSKFYCYDTDNGTWYREDSLYVHEISGAPIPFAADNYGRLIMLGEWPEDMIPAAAVAEDVTGGLKSSVTFTDFTWETPEKKGISRIHVRVYLEAGAALSVKIRYDSQGDFKEVSQITGAGRCTAKYIPITVQRCDHFTLKLEAVGEWRLHSVSVEAYAQSAN